MVLLIVVIKKLEDNLFELLFDCLINTKFLDENYSTISENQG